MGLVTFRRASGTARSSSPATGTPSRADAGSASDELRREFHLSIKSRDQQITVDMPTIADEWCLVVAGEQASRKGDVL